jgi:hypothetical protein
VVDQWLKYPNDVFVSRWGVVVRRTDDAWYAYPTGSGELGPFPSVSLAKQAIQPSLYTLLASSSPRS